MGLEEEDLGTALDDGERDRAWDEPRRGGGFRSESDPAHKTGPKSRNCGARVADLPERGAGEPRERAPEQLSGERKDP